MDSTRGAFDADAVAVEPAIAQIGAVRTSTKPCETVETVPRIVHSRSAPYWESYAVNVPTVTKAVGTTTRLSAVAVDRRVCIRRREV